MTYLSLRSLSWEVMCWCWIMNLRTAMGGARGLSRLYKVYHDLLTKHPVLVQSVQTAILCGAGDLIAQTAIEKKKLNEIDVKRFAVFSGFGGFVVGPTLRVWYGILDRKVTGSKYVAIAAGKSLEEIKEKLESDYMNILLTNYKIWPAVQFINFGFVPVNYQVPISQIVGLGWNTYISWRAYEAPRKSAVK